MHAWDIELDAASDTPFDEDRVDAIVDTLVPYSAVASYSPSHVGISMTVEAATIQAATAEAFAIALGIQPALQVTAIRAAASTAPDRLDIAS